MAQEFDVRITVYGIERSSSECKSKGKYLCTCVAVGAKPLPRFGEHYCHGNVCAVWRVVDRRTTVRYDRNMEFVVLGAVRCKQVVSLGLATLEVRFEFERCDLSGLGERPQLDICGDVAQTSMEHYGQ